MGEHLDNIDMHVTILDQCIYLNLYAIRYAEDSTTEEVTSRYIDSSVIYVNDLPQGLNRVSFERSYKNFDDALEELGFEIPRDAVLFLKSRAEEAMASFIAQPDLSILLAAGAMKNALVSMMDTVTSNVAEAMEYTAATCPKDYIEELDAGGMVDEVVGDFIPDNDEEQEAAEEALRAILNYFKVAVGK